MMLKIGMKMAQDYTVFDHGPPRPHRDINYHDRRIVSGAGVNSSRICFYHREH